MDTFKDLFEFLKNYSEDNIIDWLKIKWEGKDKQESLLRLFAGLNLINKFESFDICNGNFNKKTIIKNTKFKNVFYNKKNNLLKLKDKGDSSDLTGIHKNNDKHLLVTTSKNLNKTQIGKLDIDKILTNFKQYENDNFTMTLCICVRNKDKFLKMINNIEDTNKELKYFLEKDDTIIIDWNDLNLAYKQFKLYFSNKTFNDITNLSKNTLKLKMHQELGVLKTMNMKKQKKKKVLWGHIQRSGKSYIIAGCVIEDSKNKNECNYLIITTAPNETIEQQRKVFDCNQLDDFNIIILDGKNKKPFLTNKNIILCSKQFLQSKKIIWLNEMIFNMRFIDESHNGGTTELAQKTLEYYGNKTFTVQITATYSKPVNDYNISKDCWILWDLEDIKLCKNISNEKNINRLIEKHGNDIHNIIEMYSLNDIIDEYSKYPELWLLTDEIKPFIKDEIINYTKNNDYGWSSDSCFLLKQGCKDDKVITISEFQNEKENLKMWYKIFGKKDKYNISNNEYPDELVFMKRIEKICKNSTINSRFIGEGDLKDEPMIIMAFLPQNDISKISKATIKLLESNKVIEDYEIISINSKTTNDPKETIEDSRIKARHYKKKGVLVLSGKQCSLGVSIDNCDIVLLLNNSLSFDMIYQMMFRCMTEGKNKKCGFVVDLNIHRVIETSIINYASLIKPQEHPKEATKYILQEKLINLNGDHWMPTFGNDFSNISTLSETVYELYSSNTENALNHFLNRLKFKEILLTKEEHLVFNAMFNNITPTKIQQELINKLINENNEEVDKNIKKGIQKIKVQNEELKEDKQSNYMDILKHIIPLICLLTIHDKETSFIEMFNLIENDKYVFDILIDQTKSWWGKTIDSRILKKFINVYIKYMKDDKETNQIIRTVKELFMKNIKNSKELSNLIDKYLIPQELEKKSNAEVSTPFKLRQEMLDKMPLEFWTSPKKVFEPCSGKGGFVIDIIDRFMIGLKDTILDEKIRYKTIVEECLYFSDINPTNIFICKLLIDPYNEYKLNYNEGNTLELNIKEKWNIDGFDAVIGNPPYQNSNGNKGIGNTLWDKFVEHSLNKWLLKNKYLIYVHPQGWRQLGNKIGELLKSKQIIYLNMNNVTNGQKIFKCSTTFDYYLLKNINVYTTTIINDYKNNEYNYNLKNIKFIPNHSILDVVKYINYKHENGIIKDRSSYGTEKKWISKKYNEEYKYPCIYTINKNNELTLRYSSVNNKGHFGVIKYIISNGTGFFKDVNGKYGCTEWSYYIKCDINDMDDIEKCFNNKNFLNIVDAVKLTSNKYNYVILKHLKKNFWKEFV